MIIATRLKELRKKYHLTQRQAANILGVSLPLIAAYESGERNPSIEKLILLADLYHCTTDYILGRENLNMQSKMLYIDGLTANQLEALQILIQSIKETNSS